MKPNIYEAIAYKANVSEQFLRGVADYEIEDIELAETDEEFDDAVVGAREHIDILIWELSKVRAAISNLNRTDFE